MAEVLICSAKRTPMGEFQGELGGIGAIDLGAVAIRGVLADAGIAGDDVDETIMGIVLPASVSQAPARQASLSAGLPLGSNAGECDILR